MKPLLVMLVMCVPAAVVLGATSAEQWIPGRHYTVLESPAPTGARSGEVEVVEVFSYTCGHCYRLEHQLEAWLQKKPDYVRFVRLPATWDERQRALARLHYALAALGRTDVQMAVFEALHKDHRALVALNDDAETFRQEQAFVTQHGVAPAAFENAYKSPQVIANAQHAETWLVRYRIEGTPTMVINGKYTISPTQAATNFNQSTGTEDFGPLLALTDELVAREHHASR